MPGVVFWYVGGYFLVSRDYFLGRINQSIASIINANATTAPANQYGA